jgi:hypothetical protein
MIGFLHALGVITLILGVLGGLIACTSSFMAGVALIFSSVVSGSLLMGFSKLLEWVFDIRYALVEEELPIEKHTLDGSEFLVKPVRTKGKFGGIYQFPDTNPVSIDPQFRTRDQFINHILEIVKAARA